MMDMEYPRVGRIKPIRRHKNPFRRHKKAEMNVLLNPPVSPGTYLKQNGKEDIFEDLPKLREEIRRFARANDTLASVIRVTSMFASQGPAVKCEDPNNHEILNQIFDPDKLEIFFQSFFKEFLITGAVASVAVWDSNARSFTDEQLIEGNSFKIIQNENYGDDSIQIFTGRNESVENHTEVTGAPNYLNDNGIREIDNDNAIWAIHKDRPSDVQGYPFFAPALSALYQKESLDGALSTELNQLAKPLIIATVDGLDGDVASPEVMNHISELLVQAQMADLRELVLPSQVDIRNAFSGVQVQDLGKYYEWSEEAILRVVGVSRTLLDGSQAGPYASGALNRDVFSGVIKSLRVAAINAFQKRIDKAIKECHLYMMRNDKGGKRKLMTVDDYGNLSFDPNGTPAYEEAKLTFNNDILKDPNQELNTLRTLIGMDVPIAKSTLMEASGLNLDLGGQLQKIKEEDDLKNDMDINNEQVPMNNNPSQDKDLQIHENETYRGEK